MKTKATVIRGIKLKDARLQKKLSLRTLAEKTSIILGTPISYASIRRYEEGSACDMDVLIAICQVLDLDPIKLLDDSMKEAKTNASI